MGDQYKNNVAGMIGRNAKAEHTKIQVWNNAEAGVDQQTLIASLAALRPQLRAQPDSGDHDEEIGHVAAAEKAAKAGDTEGALKHLKEAGKWVLDTAAKIGESVAVKVIASALGFPGLG